MMKWILWWLLAPITKRFFYTTKWGMECPRCGWNGFDWYEPPYFKCTRSGTFAPPGEPTCHWFEGIQTCPRCHNKWEVSDSD
jgi:hypothetical protein